jgi:hypothetical protein
MAIKVGMPVSVVREFLSYTLLNHLTVFLFFIVSTSMERWAIVEFTQQENMDIIMPVATY